VKDEFYDAARSFVKKNLKRENLTLELAFIEAANTLWKHAYVFKRINGDKYEALRNSVKPLISNLARVHSSLEILEEATDNAIRYGFSIYDSLYVTLSLRENCKLVTFDDKLRSKLVEKGLKNILGGF
jgi:predicted nucleic acid-binding protein